MTVLDKSKSSKSCPFKHENPIGVAITDQMRYMTNWLIRDAGGSLRQWPSAVARHDYVHHFTAYFWDEQAAHAKLEEIVWPNGPVCIRCDATDRIGAVTGRGARRTKILLPLPQTVSRHSRNDVRGQPRSAPQMVPGLLLTECCEEQYQPIPAASAARGNQQDCVSHRSPPRSDHRERRPQHIWSQPGFAISGSRDRSPT